MASSTNPTTSGKTTKNDKAPKDPCLLFELESIAFDGTKVIYDTLANLLKPHSVELTPTIFMRFNLARPTTRNINRMLETVDVAENAGEALAAEVAELLLEKMPKAKPVPAALKLLEEAANKSIRLGAVTDCAEPVAEALLKSSGLKNKITLSPAQNGSNRIRAESWMETARQLGAAPTQCIALTNCTLTTRAALAAGMRCVAVPDSYSAHHDFGGADMVLEVNSEFKLADLMALASPVARR